MNYSSVAKLHGVLFAGMHSTLNYRLPYLVPEASNNSAVVAFYDIVRSKVVPPRALESCTARAKVVRRLGDPK